MKYNGFSNKNLLVLKVWPFWIDGIKYHDQYLSEFMDEDGVSTVFACPYQAEKSYTSFIKEGDTRLKSKYNMYFFKFMLFFNKPIPLNLIDFTKFIKLNKPDVIHIFGISNFTTVFTFFAIVFSSFQGRIVFSDHSDPTERKTGLLARCYYYFFYIFYAVFVRNRYTIIVPDLASRNELIKRYGLKISELIVIISLGYDDRVFKLNGGSKSKGLPLNVGFAGKILPPKKIETIFKILDSFNATEIQFTIAGLNLDELSDYQKRLINYVNKNEVSNVKFIPFISNNNDLANFYSTIDVALFPGSISITTFEANGCGCPIILYKSYEGLEHRVSKIRGRLYCDEFELIDTLKFYIGLKRNSVIMHSDIELESKKFSWRVLKNDYYRVYGFIK